MTPQELHAEVQRADALIEMRRFVEAEQRLGALAASHPDNAVLHRKLSNVLRYTGKRAESLEAAKRAVHLAPEDADGLISLAHAALLNRKAADAVVAAETAVRLAPNAWATHYTLGDILRHDRTRSRDALNAAKRAAELNPHTPSVYNLMGLCWHALKYDDQALDAYEHGLRLDPHNALILNNIGVLRLRNQRYREATEAIMSGLSIDAQDQLLRGNLSAVFVSVTLKVGFVAAIGGIGLLLVAFGNGVIRSVFGLIYALVWLRDVRAALMPLPPSRRLNIVWRTFRADWKFRTSAVMALLLGIAFEIIALAPRDAALSVAPWFVLIFIVGFIVVPTRYVATSIRSLFRR